MVLLDDFSDREIEEEKKFSSKSSIDDNLNLIVRKYEEWLKRDSSYMLKEEYAKVFASLDDLKELKKRDIHYFVDYMQKYKEAEKYTISGIYLSALLEKSFNCGHNDFVIKTETPILWIGAYLSGKQHEKLFITIDGPAGMGTGYYGTNLFVRIKGKAEAGSGKRAENSVFIFEKRTGQTCCERTKNCYCIFNGYAGSWAGYETKDSTMVFNGNCGEDCASYTENSNVLINGNIGHLFGFLTRGTDFYSQNINTLNKVRVRKGGKKYLIKRGCAYEYT